MTALNNEKTISNTLTRWHKIAERVKIAAVELQAANLRSMQGGHNVDSDTFSVRRAALTAAAQKAVGEQTALYFSLQKALYIIRGALSHANTTHGVSGLLNQMEVAKQRSVYYSNMLETAEDALTVEEFDALCAKKDKTANASSSGRYATTANVTLISAAALAEMAEYRDAAKREVNSLADKLADANASKLELVIEDAVSKVIGL